MNLALHDGWTIAQDAPVGPQLRRILRERIIRGDLAPGARLSESEIARAYDLSRQPVREAFIKLAEEGLVEVRPQRGTFVRRISVAAVMDARFVREAIEVAVVRRLAPEADATLLAGLRSLVARQAEVPDAEPERFLALDEAFHRSLAEAAGIPYAWRVVEEVKAQMDRVRWLGTLHLPTAKLVRQHGDIVDALAAGDPEAAGAAMHRHLTEILTDLPAIAAARPELFEGPAAAGPRNRPRNGGNA